MKKFLKKTVNIALAMTMAGSICIGGMPDMAIEAAEKLPTVKIGQEDTTVESDRLHLNFNREWKFESQRVTDDTAPDFGGAINATFDDSNWTEVGLPHSFSIPYNMEPNFFVGYGLYRKTFNVPEEWIKENKRVSIEFEGSFIETEVFINGKLAGTHLGGYTGFEIDLTDYIKVGENTLAVRVNNKWRPDQAPRIGEHQFSGGIYRDVYLNVTNPVHITWYGTYVTTPALNNPGFDEKGEDGQLLWDYECIDETAYTPAEVIMENIKKKQSDVAVSTEVKNETGSAVSVIVRHIVVDKADEKVVAYFDSEKTSIPAGEMVNIPAKSDMIKNIKLWDLDNPNLYKVETIVYNADTKKVIDTFESPLGFRWAQFLTDGMYLNGEKVYLFGAGFHQDRAGWGDAGTNTALNRDVKMVKEVGMNFIRAVTYPRDEALAEACDEHGVLLWTENTFWGMGGHLNAAKDSKTITYTSADWDATAYPDNEKDYARFNESCLQDMEAMIRVNRNHPSIILWSSGNEVFFETDEQVPLCKALLKELKNLSHKMDPTRKVALGGTQRGNLDSLEYCDVAGYNGDGGKFNYHGEGKSGTGMGQWGITMKMPCMASEYGSYTSSRGDKADTYAPHFHEISDGKGGYIESDANRNGVALWCAYHHGTVGGAGLAQMGFVDYSRLPLKTWYWYRENYMGVAPEFSKEGKGTKLTLTASQTIITNDGTSDAQLIVTVTDDEGNWVNETTDIDLEVITGPGVFPTGKAFKLTKGNTMRDGKGSIDFHSWYSGETVIRAYAEGLESAEITITTIDTTGDETKNEPENFLEAIKDDGGAEKLLDAGIYGGGNFIANRPTNASSGKSTAALATDGKKETFWKAEKSGNGEYWQVFTEFSALVYKMRVEFPEGEEIPYNIETATSSEGPWTVRVSYDRETVKNRPYEDDLNGAYASYIRISFPNLTNEQTAMLSDVYVYAMAASTGPTDGSTDATYTPESVYLSDIKADKLTQGWEGQTPGLDVSIQGKPLTIGGTVYKKGLGLHANSEAIYSLDGKYTRFRAVVGIDDEVGSNKADTIYRVYVTVKGEEKLIYEKNVTNNVIERIDLSVRGAEKLRLVTDSNGRNSNDHTNWADARLIGAERSMTNGIVTAKIATNKGKLVSGEDFEIYLTMTNTGTRAKYTSELTILDKNGNAVKTANEEIVVAMKDVVYKTMSINVPLITEQGYEATLSIYNAENGELLADNIHYEVENSQKNAPASRELVWKEFAKINGVEPGNAHKWVMEQGISDGTDPEGLITREQLVTMLYRYEGSYEVNGDLNAFIDSSEVSSWAKNALIWATSTGVIKGSTEGQLMPKQLATCEQVEIIMSRLKERLNQTTVGIKQVSKDGKVINETTGSVNAELVVTKYSNGDKLVFETEENGFLWVKAGVNMPEHLIYVPNGKYEFEVPIGEINFNNLTRKRFEAYDSENFKGTQVVTVRVATKDDLKTYRNLAINPLDGIFEGEKNKSDAPLNSLPIESVTVENGSVTGYPHAYANRVTRNESWYYSRNAIDGISAENSHGPYPHHAWGGGQYEDIAFTVYFGREVLVDKVVLTLRSDYTVKKDKEHDTYWKEAVIEFSDGSEVTVNPVKGGQAQTFEFEARKTEYVRLKKLVPYEEPNSTMYAALNEIEVWGYDAQ